MVKDLRQKLQAKEEDQERLRFFRKHWITKLSIAEFILLQKYIFRRILLWFRNLWKILSGTWEGLLENSDHWGFPHLSRELRPARACSIRSHRFRSFSASFAFKGSKFFWAWGLTSCQKYPKMSNIPNCPTGSQYLQKYRSLVCVHGASQFRFQVESLFVEFVVLRSALYRIKAIMVTSTK